jgi:hypothetical protein
MPWPGMQDALLWGKYQTRRRGGFATSRPTQSTKPSLKAIPFDLTLYADFIFELKLLAKKMPPVSSKDAW